MLCERCGKNEASVHLTRIINGKKEEMHLCEKCAGESSQFNIDDNNLGFQSLLSGILNHNFSNNESSIYAESSSDDFICQNCGLSYQEFTQKGLFGCEECFNDFDEKLDSLFKRIHGNIRHTGKRPVSFREKMEAESEISELNKKMQTAVKEENFEMAAEIRDKIHAIKENMEADKDES